MTTASIRTTATDRVLAGIMALALLASGMLPAFSVALMGVSLFAALSPALADDDDDDDDDDRPRRRVFIERAAPRPAARPARESRPSGPELVALLPAGQSTDALVAAGYDVVTRSNLPALGRDILKIRSTRRESTAAAVRRLRDLLPGQPVDLNVLYRPSLFECSVAGCDTMAMVGWPAPPAACQLETTIGMIDTAVQAGHPAFATGRIERLTMRSPTREASSDRHGTAIAALLVGQTDSAHPGLLPRARLVAVDVFHRGSGGTDAADAFDLARGLDALIARDIRLVNLSLAGPDSPILRQMVEFALSKGLTLVAAAGNAGANARPMYPGAYQGVITVTAIDRNGQLYRRANRGEHIDFAAPGVDLVAVDTTGRMRPQSGTSLAVPFVTAAAAIVLARQDKELRPVVDILGEAASDRGAPGKDREYGWGVVKLADSCASVPVR